MRWMVAFVFAGSGLVAINCGSSSDHSRPLAGSGGSAGDGKGGAATTVGGTTARGEAGAGGAGEAAAGASAAGGDASCSCGSEDPACVARLANSCGLGTSCPPKLDALLAYGTLPHEPRGLSDASYGVCDDGTSRFTLVDPFGESGTIYVFDSQGRLVFDGNYLQSICGDPPPLDQQVSCQWCEIMRAGGLDEIGQAGTGGEGGAAGATAAPSGEPYCLLDGDGKLVMPSN